jgi:branched-chain amino acid transport system substrate-binding protein
MVGAMLAPDFTSFWTQAHQRGYKPKVVCVNKALTPPEAVTAMGELGNHLCCDVTITPRNIWIDSLSGMSTKQLCDEYEAFSGQQWTEAQLCLVAFEWANDILKRVTNVDDKEAYVTAIKSTKLKFSLGTIDYTAPVEDGLGGGKHHPYPNACSPPQGTGQWVKATSGKWMYDKVICSAYDAGPGYNQLPIEAKLLSMEYSA